MPVTIAQAQAALSDLVQWVNNVPGTLVLSGGATVDNLRKIIDDATTFITENFGDLVTAVDDAEASAAAALTYKNGAEAASITAGNSETNAVGAAVLAASARDAAEAAKDLAEVAVIDVDELVATAESHKDAAAGSASSALTYKNAAEAARDIAVVKANEAAALELIVSLGIEEIENETVLDSKIPNDSLLLMKNDARAFYFLGPPVGIHYNFDEAKIKQEISDNALGANYRSPLAIDYFDDGNKILYFSSSEYHVIASVSTPYTLNDITPISEYLDSGITGRQFNRWIDDGNQLLVAGFNGTNHIIKTMTVSIPYTLADISDSDTFVIDASAFECQFFNNGLKFLLSSNNELKIYSCSAAYDLSSPVLLDTYVLGGSNNYGFNFSYDGSRIFGFAYDEGLTLKVTTPFSFDGIFEEYRNTNTVLGNGNGLYSSRGYFKDTLIAGFCNNTTLDFMLLQWGDNIHNWGEIGKQQIATPLNLNEVKNVDMAANHESLFYAKVKSKLEYLYYHSYNFVNSKDLLNASHIMSLQFINNGSNGILKYYNITAVDARAAIVNFETAYDVSTMSLGSTYWFDVTQDRDTAIEFFDDGNKLLWNTTTDYKTVSVTTPYTFSGAAPLATIVKLDTGNLLTSRYYEPDLILSVRSNGYLNLTQSNDVGDVTEPLTSLGHVDISSNSPSPNDAIFVNKGYHIIVLSKGNNTLDKYKVNSPYTLTGLEFIESYPLSGLQLTPHRISFNSDESRLIFIDNINMTMETIEGRKLQLFEPKMEDRYFCFTASTITFATHPEDIIGVIDNGTGDSTIIFKDPNVIVLENSQGEDLGYVYGPDKQNKDNIRTYIGVTQSTINVCCRYRIAV